MLNLSIKKENKEKLLFVLKKTNKMLKLDDEIYKATDPNSLQKDEDDHGGWWFIHYYNNLDIVYLLMVGEDHNTVYHNYDTISNIDRPSAWYRKKKDRIKGYDDHCKNPPKGVKTGFIPDCIDDIILERNMSAKKKYFLLEAMFNDLIELEQKFKKKQQKVKRK